MQTGEDAIASNGMIDNVPLHDADIYQTLSTSSGERTFYYGTQGSMTLTNLTTGESVTMTIRDGTNYIGSLQATAVEFVDMEGSYSFLIRDTSNTTGRNAVSELVRFSAYPSASQYITVSADTSSVQVNYGEGGTSSQLFLASYYSTNGTGTESTRQSYYTPTSYEGVLNVSYKPTVDTTQINTLTLAYYPYETRFVANKAANGYVQLSFYRTLAAQPSFTNTIYSFDQNGAAASDETRTYQVNISDTMTAEGKYVLTRTYMTGEGYTINNFDYATRELTFYVDRNNVITETSTVMADAQTYTLERADEDTPSPYTLTIYGNLYVIEGPEGWLRDTSREVTFTGDNAPTSYVDGNRYWNMGNYSYYIMPEDFVFESLSITVGGATYTTAGESPVESSLSTMESVVGGDIFVNMYDAQPGDSGSILSVTFPNTTLTDGITLGSGETFFTSEQEENTPTPVLETNKLPVKVYIPEFKYTIFNSEIYNNTDASVSYESNENPLLSYYDQNAQAISQIAAYRLSAVITDSHGETYVSNGVDENGYLTFVSTADGSTLTELSQEGTYTVEITQNATGSGAGTANDFKKSYKFAFNITQSSPEFELSTVGRALETLGDENYYTNQKTFTATWVDQNSPYIANIDKAHILLEFSNNYPNNMIVDVSSGTPSVVLAENGETTAQTELVQSALEYQSSGYNNTLTLNFEEAGIYNQNACVRVTMQFVGHNADYYDVTTKTVTIDKIASYDSLDALIANVSPFSNGTVSFNETTLRNYFNVEGTPVSGKTEAAYNTSVSSGNLQYYSYLVDNAFLQNLARAAAENNTSSHAGRTIRVYSRQIDNPYDDTYIETSYDNFTPTNFTELSSEDLDSGYYEIVEQDLAGNLTIYLVYLYSDNTDDGFAATVDEYGNITDEDDDSIDYSEEYIAALQGIQFSDGDRLVQISDAQILAQQTSGRVVEMFSSKNFSLEKLNLRGDAWLTLTVSQANTTARSYLFSPWLAESQMVIDMQSGQTVSFDQIFAEFVSSSSSSLEINLQISNRAQGGTLQAALNLANGASLTANYSSSQTEEYLSIRRSDLVYPVSVKINLGNEEEPYYYNVSNDPNALENLQNSSYSYLNSWTTDKVSFSYDFERLWFKFVTLPASNTKVRYEIKDNFGNVTTLIHIFGETYFKPVTSSGNLYQDLISNPAMNDDSEDFFSVHVSGNDVTYRYNESIYAVLVTSWQDGEWKDPARGTYNKTESGNIVSLTFSRGEAAQIDRWFRIYVDEIPADADESYTVVADDLTHRVDNIFIHLYEMRPELDVPRDEGVAEPEYLLTFRDHYGENVTGDILTDDETYETVTVGGRDYRVTSQGSTFALNLTVDYTDPSSLDYPYEVLYYNAATMSGFESLPSRTTISESGIYYFLVRYAQNANGVLANEYDLYKIEILDSASEFYRVTNNGVLVERAPSYYTYDGTQYSDYYIVNVNYNQDSASVQIVPNDYQQITASSVGTIPEGNGVVTVQYLVTNYIDDAPPTTAGVSAFNRYVFVTFIPPTSNPVPSAVYYFNQNEQFDILSSSSISAVVPRENTSQDTVTIRWTSSYGISSNYVYINVLKDGTAFFNSEDMTAASQALVSYRTDGDFNYITLNRSGTYTISFSDEAGNQQAFASNVRALRFVFLKDVAFSMTYTDASTGEQIVSDPIQKGVFNGSVGLTILNMSDYYTAASTGSGEGMIRASRNGATYSGYAYDATSHTFTFSEPGYYSVSFVATSISGVEVREQTYNFTIVNPNESRYSFEFAPYQDYYITSVVKDNLGDISGDIIANMQSYGLNLQTISIDGQTYLRELVTSYIGLGSGRYTVTIATRSSYNRENYSEPTEMTFSYWINTASVPIDISLQEGASTSSPITVSFNAERIYQAVGECMVTIGLNTYYITGENASSFGVVNAPPIEASGTYFITVRSMSGNLLFSYKVIKTEPLNGWAIAAIVIGCVVAIAAVIIIVKLRKRIKVK